MFNMLLGKFIDYSCRLSGKKASLKVEERPVISVDFVIYFPMHYLVMCGQSIR